MKLATVLNSRLFIEGTGYTSMVEPEPPEDPKFPKLFDSGRSEETGARSFLLWIEECYIEADQYRDPTITESHDIEDKVKFVKIHAGLYLAESTGTFGNWKVVVSRNNKGVEKTPWAYEFKTIEGDLTGLCRYLTNYRIGTTLRKNAPQ